MKRNISFIFTGALIASIGWGIFFFIAEKPATVSYSTQSQGIFPGLKIYGSDFLIPINRLELTPYVFVDDPNENYGSGNMPVTAMLFRINEPGACHYFMVSGPQWRELTAFKYLGANIDIRQACLAGNGYYMVTYNPEGDEGKTSRCFVPASCIYSIRMKT